MDDPDLRSCAAEAFRYMDGAPHPSIEQIGRLSAGELSGSARETVESHVNACDLCRRRTQEFNRFASDCKEAPVEELSAEWRALSGRINRHRAAVRAAKWGAVAAAAVAAVGLSWLVIRMLTPSPSRLLADAYYEQRSFDIRLASAKHSDIKRQRGADPSATYPIPLLKAVARLAEERKANPDDPEILRLEGEAEMMQGRATNAVQILQRAQDLRSNDPRILADLGAAYTLRGDIEHRYGDYLSAVDCLGQSLHLRAHVPDVVFNLALALERAQLKDQAVEQWNEYLKLDGAGGWAEEAKQHLADLKKTLQSRDDALHRITNDPARFLALVAGGSTIDAEAYLSDIAVSKWLPLATAAGPAREAITRLARTLKERHGDAWLEDLVKAGMGTQLAPAFQQLGAARSMNLNGQDMQPALASAREAAKTLLDAGNRPASLWARFEQVSSLHALFRHEECLAAADSLMRDLDTHPYVWLRAQLRIEMGICLLRIAQLTDASARLREANEIAHRAGFGGTELRASVQYMDCTGHTGLPSESLSSAQDSLRVFWDGNHHPLAFQQLVDRLRVITTAAGQRAAACFLARSDVWAAKQTMDPSVEGPARANLAAAAQAVGEEAEAQLNLQLADQLFAGVPYGYRLEPELSLTSVELERGDADAALARLNSLGPGFPSALVATEYYGLLGRADLQKGLAAPAIDAFRKSIETGRLRVASVAAERERAGVLRAIEPSYRGLTEAVLSSEGPAAALRQWQSFRELDSTGNPNLVSQDNDARITFAELGGKYLCWFTQRGQLTAVRLPISKEELARTVRRFRRECSDPVGDPQRLWKDSRQLYQWTIGQLADRLAGGDRALVLDLDGVLTGLPIQALTTDDGQYFGDRFSVLLATGPKTTKRAVPGNASALIIADPELRNGHQALFPPLPETLSEARAVRAAFPAGTTLQGADATVDALERQLPGAQLVHFAGHGYSDSENGGLVFAPSAQGNEDYTVLSAADLRYQDWSSCRLAVLSACAAGEGETQGAYNPDSLVRALTKAGASSVLACLWNADSASTRELMRVFYASLAKGIEPADALRMARQWVRRQPGWEHPYYWAGFQLYGTA